MGIIAVSLMETLQVDLMGYLFGDILAIGEVDLLWIYTGGAAALCVLAWIWRDLIAITVHEELAGAEGVPTFGVQLTFMLLIAFVIAIAMKLIGILLITSMLIIPAAIARRFSKTPEQMAVLAILAGVTAVVIGLWASLQWNTPAGPSVVRGGRGVVSPQPYPGNVHAQRIKGVSSATSMPGDTRSCYPMVQFDSCRFALVVGCAGYVCPEPAFPRICGHRVRRGPVAEFPCVAVFCALSEEKNSR